MGEVGAAYAGCKARICEIVSGIDGGGVMAEVPTCPDWSVHDVVAHLAGVVDDALAGRLDGVATDAWTAAQVDARRACSVADIVAEWHAQAPAFEALLDPLGDIGRQAVADIVTHEHDIRTALGRAGSRDSDAVRIGLGFVAPALVDNAAALGVSLRVRATEGSEFGDVDADVVLQGGAFELLRAMTGRRSGEQLRAMAWEGDAEAVLPAFRYGPFRPAVDPIPE